jgi:periplasmic protein TonB
VFEDSLVESLGRIHTQSRWFAIGSFFAQAALLLLLALDPLLHPLGLPPRQSIERLLIAPAAPQLPAHAEIRRASSPSPSHPALPSLQTQLQAPSRIPNRIAAISDAQSQPPGPVDLGGPGNGPGIPGGIALGSPAPTISVAHPPALKHPVTISSGVAAGQLLSPIRPDYPAIAKAARIQGTIVIEATISRAGTIKNLHVTEGPPMLRQAAIDAVAAARYRPFLLNGEPVEVQTTIHVIFSLGG